MTKAKVEDEIITFDESKASNSIFHFAGHYNLKKSIAGPRTIERIPKSHESERIQKQSERLKYEKKCFNWRRYTECHDRF
jgi:hypothetical protein